jgi:hypothetical protein
MAATCWPLVGFDVGPQVITVPANPRVTGLPKKLKAAEERFRRHPLNDEASIHETSDSSLVVWFNFLLAYDVEGVGRRGLSEFSAFDRRMGGGADVTVVRENRVCFGIEISAPTTSERLSVLVERYWRAA